MFSDLSSPGDANADENIELASLPTDAAARFGQSRMLLFHHFLDAASGWNCPAAAVAPADKLRLALQDEEGSLD